MDIDYGDYASSLLDFDPTLAVYEAGDDLNLLEELMEFGLRLTDYTEKAGGKRHKRRVPPRGCKDNPNEILQFEPYLGLMVAHFLKDIRILDQLTDFGWALVDTSVISQRRVTRYSEMEEEEEQQQQQDKKGEKRSNDDCSSLAESQAGDESKEGDDNSDEEGPLGLEKKKAKIRDSRGDVNKSVGSLTQPEDDKNSKHGRQGSSSSEPAGQPRIPPNIAIPVQRISGNSSSSSSGNNNENNSNIPGSASLSSSSGTLDTTTVIDDEEGKQGQQQREITKQKQKQQHEPPTRVGATKHSLQEEEEGATITSDSEPGGKQTSSGSNQQPKRRSNRLHKKTPDGQQPPSRVHAAEHSSQEEEEEEGATITSDSELGRKQTSSGSKQQPQRRSNRLCKNTTDRQQPPSRVRATEYSSQEEEEEGATITSDSEPGGTQTSSGSKQQPQRRSNRLRKNTADSQQPPSHVRAAGHSSQEEEEEEGATITSDSEPGGTRTSSGGKQQPQRRSNRLCKKTPDHQRPQMENNPDGGRWHKEWNEKYERLQQFKADNGHCVVPVLYNKDPALGRWVRVQRTYRRKGTLAADRVEKLNKIGFSWVPQKHHDTKKWDDAFSRLKKFKDKNGHCRVPQQYRIDPHLGKWVGHQRHYYNMNKLPADHVERLNEIGFEWDLKKWDKVLDRLKKFKEDNGHCRVPRKYNEDPALGNWVIAQRVCNNKGSLPADRIEKLNKIGFIWESSTDHLTNHAATKKWDDAFGKLKKFKEKNGHCQVPSRYSADPFLGKWAVTQRHYHKKNQLPAERMQKLNEIGFDWDGNKSTGKV